jgi:hypothetical protein
MKDQEKEKEEVKKSPAAKGRNATDNFNEDQTDDYGIDYSKPGAEEELQAREEIKGGTGQRGKDRNPNDNFNE